VETLLEINLKIKKMNVKQSNLNHVETTLNETKKLKNLKITKNTAEKF